jgi:uncharacterized protein YgiB involved in biofilm formation
MKKSRSIKLVLLGSASFALVACGDDGPPQDAQFFADTQQCAAQYDRSICETAKTEAEQKFAAEAPRYTRQEECEAEFGAGNCETRQTAGGGSFFMPMLMGYMLGNMLGGNQFNQPVYRGPNNSALTSSRSGKAYNIGTFAGTGRTATATSSFRPSTQVTQVSRGGFGSSSRSYSSTSSGS